MYPITVPVTYGYLPSWVFYMQIFNGNTMQFKMFDSIIKCISYVMTFFCTG